MNTYRLEEIKKLRKKYHLTQKQLASRAQVSQSLIAKIESNAVDPTYSNTQKIFSALDDLRNQQEVKAKEIMTTKIVFVSSTEKLKEAIKLFKSRNISQVPVLHHGKVLGMVTEAAILSKIAEKPERLSQLKVEDVLEDAPPIVPPNTGIRVLLNLLQGYPIVLVAEKGEIRGIIAKSDVLGKVE